MDYNFSWPDVRVEPRLRLNRTIALSGVLRELSETVPDDAVFFYLNNTDCSGLKNCIFRNLWNNFDWDDKNPVLSTPTKRCFIPDAIRKMTHEYFMSILVSELEGALWETTNCTVGRNSYVFPKRIREALDRVPVTEGATLQDHKVMIDSLKASISIDTINASDSQRNMSRCMARSNWWKQQGFDILSQSQVNKLYKLRNMYLSAVRKMALDRKLLSPYEISTMCDLLIVLCILMYREGFIEAANAYTLYEYSKMAEAGHERVKRLPQIYQVSEQKNLYYTSVDACVDCYSKLSPMAALMTGRNVRIDNFYYRSRGSNKPFNWLYEQHAIKRYLESIKQPQLTSVKLFVQYEVAIQRFKIYRIQDALADANRDGNRCLCSVSCDDRADEPCEYCG